MRAVLVGSFVASALALIGCGSAPPPSVGDAVPASPFTVAATAPARTVSLSPVDIEASPPASAENEAPSLPAYATLAPSTVMTGASGRSVFVVPGRHLDPEKPPALVTVLHATCVDAKETCEFLRPIVDTRGVLVCPLGNVPCDNGAATWAMNTPSAMRQVVADTDAVEAAIERPTDARSRDVLVGSSAGAFAARNVIDLGAKRWHALILVGGKVDFAPDVLRKAGIRRVLFVAPDFDQAAAKMRENQKRLCAEGIPTRFVSLGPHGHGMIDGSETIIAASMDWLMDEGDTDECPAR